MRKRALSLFFAALILMTVFGMTHTYAEPTPGVGLPGGTVLADWDFVLDDAAGTVTLCEYIGENPVITVPGSFSANDRTYAALIDSSTAFASNGNISSVTIGEGVGFLSDTMSMLFYGCTSLSSVDFSAIDTSGVTDMSFMFFNCGAISAIDQSRFDTRNVTTISCMLYGSTHLSSLS